MFEFEFDEKLSKIVKQLENGLSPPSESVRLLLSWFGAKKRGEKILFQIYEELAERGLATSPDIKEADIDAMVVFELAPDRKRFINPMYRVRNLESANREPESVTPDESFNRVISIMLNKKYSQLPVMNGNGPHALKGMISWETIGKKIHFGSKLEYARQCMDKSPQVVSLDESLFSVIKRIAEYEYVLVREKNNTICGIVTASDFSAQYSLLAEPFLLIGEIERGIRRILNAKFTEADLRVLVKPGDGNEKDIGSLYDLTFGDYVRLMQNREYWERLSIPLDRKDFIKRLDNVRDIRNDVMHFHQNGIGEEKLTILQGFVDYLATIHQCMIQ